MTRILLLLVLLLSACKPFGPQHTLEIIGPPEILSQEEPDIKAHMDVYNRESNIVVKCSAGWYEGGPEDSRAPRTLKTQTCIAQHCNTSPGGVSEVTIWSNDYEELEHIQYMYCRVYMPEWWTVTGPLGFPDEIFPERSILSIRVPVKVHMEEKNWQQFCNVLECDSSGCECVSWY